jgi:hypothetical protein
MNEASKLTFSAEELQLVTNTSWILTKRTVIDKVCSLLGGQSAFLQQQVRTAALPAAIINSSPKIAKGENYRQLPWVMLDYPRMFDKENVFAIRTLFWWGHFFSVTLHLSGSYKKQFENKLAANIPLLKAHHFFICINEDVWQHHFNEDNYLPAAALHEEEIRNVFARAAFIKIAFRHPLQQWSEMHLLLQQSAITLLKMLED